MKNTKKLLSLLLVVAMIFSLAVPVFAEEGTATPATLASWVGGTSLKNNGDADVLSDVELTVGAVSSGASLRQHEVKTSTYGNLSATPWYGVNNYAAGTQYAYVAFQLSTKGYENLSIATVLGGNPRVPLAYKLMYSLDNETWTDVEGAITTAAVNKLESAVKSTVAVPAAAADQETVYFRIAQTAAAAPKGDSGTDAGNLYIFSLALTGTAKDPTPPTPPTPPAPTGELSGKTVILHSNDVHGMKTFDVHGTDKNGNPTVTKKTAGSLEQYAYIAALKAEYEAKGAKVIVADAGDYSQGSPYVSFTKGANGVAMMNAAGYNVATLGNHEFDYGYDQLVNNLKSANYTTVCCNILGEDGNKLFAGSTVITIGDLKVGFIGVNTPETQTKANPALIKGLKWLAGDDMIKAVNDEAAALKDKADVVVVLSHLGVDSESKPNRSTDLWAGVKGVDFIIDGHSHSVMTAGEGGEPIQSTGTAMANIGVITIDNATKKIVDNSLVKYTDFATPNETVLAKAKALMEPVDKELNVVFAKSEVDLNGTKGDDKGAIGNRNGETNLGDLITDAMLWKALRDINLNVDPRNVVAITNGGGIRASINKGDVTKKDINTVLPFGNTLSVVYVTGDKLLEALEASTYCSPTPVGGFPQVAGMTFAISADVKYDANKDTYPGSTYYGPNTIKRVDILEVNGLPFDPDATYAIVTNNFSAAGGDTYYTFAASEINIDTGLPLDEVVMEYITKELKGVISTTYAEPFGRIMYNPYTDIEGWYRAPILVSTAAGIVYGHGNGIFAPNDNVTREQYISMLYRLFGTDITPEKTVDKLPFSDTDNLTYSKEAVKWGYETGIAVGDTAGTYRPTAAITRGEMAAMTYRALEKLFGTPAPDELKKDAGFTDLGDTFFTEAVNVLANLGIIHGKGNNIFDPYGTTTRGEAATVVAYIIYIYS